MNLRVASPVGLVEGRKGTVKSVRLEQLWPDTALDFSTGQLACGLKLFAVLLYFMVLTVAFSLLLPEFRPPLKTLISQWSRVQPSC